MAQISLTIKDSLYTKEVEAVAAMGGWTAEIPNPLFVEGGTEPATIPNITKEVFFKKQIKAWARNQLVEHSNRQALASVVVEEDN